MVSLFLDYKRGKIHMEETILIILKKNNLITENEFNKAIKKLKESSKIND